MADRRPIVELGEPGTWDAGSVYGGNSLVVADDEARLYYTGASTTHAVPGEAAIGMVSWPRDRLVGLRGGSQGGTVELRPQEAGATLHLNARIHGAVDVGFAASDQGFTFRGDSLDHMLDTPAGLQGQEVSVHLHLKDAEVYSLWWD